MSKSVNAALLNAFVCPGTGHLYLGKKAIGWGIIAASFVSLCVMMTVIIKRAQAIADEIVAGNIPLDFYSIYAAVHDSVTNNLPQSLNLALWVLLACWIGGTISAFWMGKKMDDAAKQ
ncbi:hypothetical protein [Shewanella sp. KT0246]|uniref:hypothetical protein n=1 Tax=Shewanella sp. KT0246 TaxID=2815912 RepID=UPI001BC68C14|nr:hypothetical protein [Shewanella sp. KT0246]GIU52626.1 hypothetical protein TUM4249_23480 [Shewanella sp. KT0246]